MKSCRGTSAEDGRSNAIGNRSNLGQRLENLGAAAPSRLVAADWVVMSPADLGQPSCVIVGGGLTGATAAWALTRAGVAVRLLEADKVVGGHIRNEWLGGVPYEPNGAHIFHTHDAEVWKLATSLVSFVPYVHEVQTRIGERLLSWPIQMDELLTLDEWPRIRTELDTRPNHPDDTNFETWCVSIMGETLYSLYIAGYTEKQWGRPAAELSTEFAPKRVELRTDGHRGLFRDPFQGWPTGGYGPLVEALLAGSEIELCTSITRADLDDVANPDEPVILTCPLDDFYEGSEGELEWRGVRLVPKWVPDHRLYQPCTVVNEPDASVPHTRTVETKHVFPDLADLPGTVVCFEYPGAPAKHYPVYDAAGVNRATQERYERRLAMEGRSLIPAGRLARYLYINMDEAMRQGLNAARRVLTSLR